MNGNELKIHYNGTKAQWNMITIDGTEEIFSGNSLVNNATIIMK